MKLAGVQTALRLVYPPRCTICGTLVDTEFALCGPCWRDTPLISGFCCDLCGAPLPGSDPGEPTHCDDCLTIARPWSRGRSAMVYKDNGRKLVLALKHGDRHEVVRPAAQWMAQAVAPVLPDAPVLIAPVPLHRLRLLRRTFNQSALLARALGRRIGRPVCPDLLLRTRPTRSLDGLSRDQRFAELSDAITMNPARAHLVQDGPVLLVDDVMTSGATLAASAEACLRAGATHVFVLTLARVVKDA